MLKMKWTLSTAMLAAALAGSVSQASAQSEHYRGKFQLPFEARFGDVVLQPGTYAVAALEGSKGIRITGEKKSVALLSAGYDVEPGTAGARMIMVDANGMYTLQSFESGVMGKSLHFIVGKSARGTVERASARPPIEVGMQ